MINSVDFILDIGTKQVAIHILANLGNGLQDLSDSFRFVTQIWKIFVFDTSFLGPLFQGLA
jgi:hypothetical protein